MGTPTRRFLGVGNEVSRGSMIDHRFGSRACRVEELAPRRLQGIPSDGTHRHDVPSATAARAGSFGERGTRRRSYLRYPAPGALQAESGANSIDIGCIRKLTLERNSADDGTRNPAADATRRPGIGRSRQRLRTAFPMRNPNARRMLRHPKQAYAKACGRRPAWL
jgi:hypothetical protein